MAGELGASVGALRLKNPLIAGAAEHLIEEAGVRAALRAGAAVVVMKSTNEVDAAKAQLDAAEYAVFDETWRRREWNASAPASAFIACRSGLYPGSFDQWLESLSRLDREAQKSDAYVAASLILGDLDHAIKMARQVQDAGLRLLELNIGTPYASQAAKGAVATELLPERVTSIVSAVRAAVSLPLWVKITGQSERVPELARAAFAAGADSVVMAGRLLGLIPDLETMRPVLGTTLGVGGYWNLPLTCHWLALSRAAVGRDKPLIATNGIQNGFDIARVMLAGASAAEISSPVMLRGFELIERSLAELKDYLKQKNIDAQDLIGRAADTRKTFAEMPKLEGNWRNYVPRDGLNTGVLDSRD
jgi:dihydroorotate dehydrogenase (NAD+) catalytic subunit